MGLTACAKTGCSRTAFNILIACVLAACSGPVPKAPVADMPQPPSYRLQEHIVATGETLYSIAWRYNLDHRELARANGIGRNHTIFPGQRLTLDMTHRPPVASTVAVAPARPAVAPRAAPPRPAPEPTRSKNRTKPAEKKPVLVSRQDPTNWQWPVRGPVLSSFASNGGLNKGIDIGGKLGEPVLAAAAGDVVYSGSGLRGYGKLVIVKHSEKYLSAYAHNRELLVEEGDKVKAGQRIAEVGSSGTDRVKLHFEIRHDGKPVDPLKYLPRQ